MIKTHWPVLMPYSVSMQKLRGLVKKATKIKVSKQGQSKQEIALQLVGQVIQAILL